MKRFFLMSLTLGSWATATACGRLGIGDDPFGDGDASVGDGDGDGDSGDGDGDSGDGDGDGDSGDGDEAGGSAGDGDSGDGDGDGDAPIEPSFPTCTILSPLSGTRIPFHGERFVSTGNDTEPVFSGIEFKAEAHDLEDGALSGESIVWYLEGADSEEVLGYGDTIVVDKLPSGEQKIVCSVIDSDGNHGYGDVEVVSVSPLLYVTHPSSSDEARPLLQAIEFSAVGFDYEDGTLNPATFTWESDIDGPLGTGDGSYLLSLGQHKVTVKGYDSHQNAGAAGVNVTVALVMEDPLPPIETDPEPEPDPEPVPLPPVQ